VRGAGKRGEGWEERGTDRERERKSERERVRVRGSE
jgi:hypothetical protein